MTVRLLALAATSITVAASLTLLAHTCQQDDCGRFTAETGPTRLCPEHRAWIDRHVPGAMPARRRTTAAHPEDLAQAVVRPPACAVCGITRARHQWAQAQVHPSCRHDYQETHHA